MTRPTPLHLATAAVLALTACTTNTPNHQIPGDPMSTYPPLPSDIAARPDITIADADYRRLVTDLARAIHTHGGPDLTTATMDVNGSACAGVRNADVENRGYYLRTGTVMDPTRWPAVYAAVLDIARTHGYTRVLVLADAPGRHDIQIVDDHTHGYVTVGAHDRGTYVGIESACHPRADMRHLPTTTPTTP